MPYDDSDMKIMPNDPSKLFDSSEGAAIAFLRETHNGNMEKARKLGMRLAAELLEGDGIRVPGIAEEIRSDPSTRINRKVLFACVANQVLEDIAPTSIVAQSALSAFYEEVRRLAPEIYERITDAAAFSLYILAMRSAPQDSCAIGHVFARLCGREQDETFVEYGCALAARLKEHCTEIALAVELVR